MILKEKGNKMSIVYRCSLKSCPHFSSPCESSDMYFKCPIGEIDECGFEEIFDEDEEFFCLIVGTRTFNDYSFFVKKMDKILESKKDKRIIIVSGGAKGTDALAERYAIERNYKLYVINANWRSGKSAGYIRNNEMHKFISEHKDRGCVAFWDGVSKGTSHSIELAKKYNNQLRLIRI